MFAYSYSAYLLASNVGSHSWQECPWPVTGHYSWSSVINLRGKHNNNVVDDEDDDADDVDGDDDDDDDSEDGYLPCQLPDTTLDHP